MGVLKDACKIGTRVVGTGHKYIEGTIVSNRYVVLNKVTVEWDEKYLDNQGNAVLPTVMPIDALEPWKTKFKFKWDKLWERFIVIK